MKIGRNKQGVLYWTDYIDGKRIKRESKFWKTQKEAREHYNEFIKKLDKDKTLLEDKSYNDVVEEYLKHIQLSHKPSTVTAHDQLLTNTVGSFFGKYKVKEIKPSDIEKWQLKIINKKQSNGKPYSNNYLKKLQFSLRQLLDLLLSLTTFKRTHLIYYRSFINKYMNLSQFPLLLL